MGDLANGSIAQDLLGTWCLVITALSRLKNLKTHQSKA
jgi:hypothetical protein